MKKLDVPFKAIVDQLSVGIVFVDPENRITYCNDAEARIRGIAREDLVGQSILNCHSPEVRPQVNELLNQLRREPGPGYMRMNDREAHFVEQWFSPLVDDAGQYLGMLLVSSDVTARESAKRRFETLATRDEPTGLFNKQYFGIVFAGLTSRLGHDLDSLVIMMTDINGLKAVNDTQGHAAGDELIAGAAETLRRSVRSSDLVFRFGGDEFVILMPDGDEKAAIEACGRIKKACRRWSTAHPGLNLSLGVGWDLAVRGEDAEPAFARADAAMYEDKKREKAKAAADAEIGHA